MSTAFFFHELCVAHDTGSAHPERSQRVVAVRERLEGGSLRGALDVHEPREATEDELTRVHAAEHVTAVRRACERAGGAVVPLDGDTRVAGASYEAALRAAGGVLEAVEGVLAGRWRNAFTAVRPPGHHAEHARAMGFCLFNNVAVAAAALREAHGLERVAILDWDVHHGNGTQHLFESDPSVFYASLHEWPLYPGTGAADECGRGEGEGATLNCPQPGGSGDAAWIDAVETHVVPAFEAFRPDFVLLSAGFDAHWRDPLASCRLTEDGYRRMTRLLVDLADRTCGGRLVSVLEGGYDLEALAAAAEAHVEVLVEGA